MTSNGGAKFTVNYKHTEHDIVSIPVMEIKDASSSALEEVAVFAFGNFLASGSFWLGVERFVTEGIKDPVLIGCGSAFLAGLVLTIVGFRQTARRVSRLMRYVPQEAARD